MVRATKKEQEKNKHERSIPMRNKQIDTLMTKFKIGPSGMPYNPAYKSGRNPKVKDSIIVKNRYKNANRKTT